MGLGTGRAGRLGMQSAEAAAARGVRKYTYVTNAERRSSPSSFWKARRKRSYGPVLCRSAYMSGETTCPGPKTLVGGSFMTLAPYVNALAMCCPLEAATVFGAVFGADGGGSELAPSSASGASPAVGVAISGGCVSLWNWITAFTATLARRPPVVGAGGAPSFVGAAPMHTEYAKLDNRKAGCYDFPASALSRTHLECRNS